MSVKQKDSLQAIKAVQEELINRCQLPSCITCIKWNKDSEICGRYNARPPARVIVLSCSDWEMDIPF